MRLLVCLGVPLSYMNTERDAKNVSISVFASVFGFEVGLPLDDTDACAEGRLVCPVVKGQRQTLRYDLKVKDSYYPVSTMQLKISSVC